MTFKAIADRFGAQLRITRLRPSGRGADVWHELHPLPGQQRELYDWLVAHGEDVLTGDSFFHLSAYGSALPGLNLCGAGRVVCLIDPVGDVYACPFAIHEQLPGGQRARPGGFESVWRESALFRRLREPGDGGACRSCGHYDSCRGGCMAAKFFTGLPLDGPDPECVQGYGEAALAAVTPGAAPKPRRTTRTGPPRRSRSRSPFPQAPPGARLQQAARRLHRQLSRSDRRLRNLAGRAARRRVHSAAERRKCAYAPLPNAANAHTQWSSVGKCAVALQRNVMNAHLPC